MTDPLPPRPVRLAAAAYPIEVHSSWSALADKLDRWVGEAAGRGADIAVLPEYAGLETACIDPLPPRDTVQWCRAAAATAARYADLCAGLAHRHQVLLMSGTLPVETGGAFVNRGFLCPPDRPALPVDKQLLVPWERRNTPLTAGPALPVLDTPLGRVAALICYDSEFPPLARALAPDILLMPSCTEAPAGAARVRIAARARALEMQGVTVLASLLGAVPGCDFVDANTGRAGIYAAPDLPFPASGILAEGAPDVPGWVHATVDPAALSTTRRDGAVAPRAHMGEADKRASRITPPGPSEDDP